MDYKIIIFETDEPTARSQKDLLGYSHKRVKLAGSEVALQNSNLSNSDVVVIDLNEEVPQCFRALDFMLRAARVPKLLITTFENEILQSQDSFGDREVHILFKPYLPQGFVAAINKLCLA